MLVLGIDPGFASVGWGLVELNDDTEKLLALGVITTTKSTKKQNVLATDDNVRRMREIHTELKAIADIVNGLNKKIHVITIESQSWPRNASAAAKVAMAWGVIVSFACERNIALVQASPMQIKVALTGIKTASKEQVLDALRKHPGMESVDRHLSKIRTKGKHEHPVDAVASVIACLTSDAILIGRRM